MPYAETRAEHLGWCKTRALELLDAGDGPQAFVSMCSDLQKHEETKNHSAITLGAMLLFNGHLDSDKQMRDWIVGFQ